MKTKKTISGIFASLLTLIFCLSVTQYSAQDKKGSKDKHEECCVMQDGKMMHVMNGKMMPMEKEMTMKDGTVCMVNGECVMKNGKKMTLKEGECIDMNGKKHSARHHDKKHDQTTTYVCPMHPDVTSDKAGKCSKCGMALEKKK